MKVVGRGTGRLERPFHRKGADILASRRCAGRPSKYQPEYCDIVEMLGAKGKSPAQIASILNVDRASLYRWAANYSDFSQSLARAKTFEQAWWEEEGRKNLRSPHFEAGLWCMTMSARFQDYKKRRPK